MKFNYNLEKTDLEGRNIIHRTCLNLKRNIIINLLAQIKDVTIVNNTDHYGNSPLILTCKKYISLNKKNALKSRKVIIESLCEIGAKIDLYQTQTMWTAFHWLCFNGDFESLKYIFFRNAVYFTPDKDGFFPIDIAGSKVYSC